jgi:hypothetical protein
MSHPTVSKSSLLTWMVLTAPIAIGCDNKPSDSPPAPTAKVVVPPAPTPTPTPAPAAAQPTAAAPAAASGGALTIDQLVAQYKADGAKLKGKHVKVTGQFVGVTWKTPGKEVKELGLRTSPDPMSSNIDCLAGKTGGVALYSAIHNMHQGTVLTVEGDVTISNYQAALDNCVAHP